MNTNSSLNRIDIRSTSGGRLSKSENLGEILRGDRIVNTGYDIRMKVNEKCKILCSDVELKPDQVKKVIKRIKDAYHVHN